MRLFTEWRAMTPASSEAEARLAVVIPCLNAATTLPRTLDSLAAAGVGGAGMPVEVVAVDGGSTDDTPHIARSYGARLVAAPKGRGVQLAAGAAATEAEWLLFLHADTVMTPECGGAIRRFSADPGNRERAGWFRLRFDDSHPAARLIAAGANRRARLFGLPYGDQGLLMTRAFHDALGGFRPMPLMEDVDMVRRIGRRRLVGLDATVVTSADRYRRDGWVTRPVSNLLCMTLFALGVSPDTIAGIYGR